ncbi:unnamed protein product [Didymodactylos carnosus]|uniref:MULE transposase domain-containing protein n=2 Tax=Didymodactylos carnosus TaxID=1234261 RepID=A0A8S2J486_9BILA|nr:unnamed protein product [Didymodactylos carnosus]CAF3790614.1 unnamed protein product [Didymodactylos carnosus]
MEVLPRFQYLILLDNHYITLVYPYSHYYQKTLESLVIPQQMACTSLDEQFLFCNNPYPYPVLGFCSTSALEILALPNKNETSYEILLDRLLSYATEQNVALSPQSILIDFEVASWNAFSRKFPKFPTAKVKGCHFHSAQNIWKKIKKYGLTKLILNNGNARRQVANMMALPLLPPNEVNEAFTIISKVIMGKTWFLETLKIATTFLNGG